MKKIFILISIAIFISGVGIAIYQYTPSLFPQYENKINNSQDFYQKDNDRINTTTNEEEATATNTNKKNTSETEKTKEELIEQSYLKFADKLEKCEKISIELKNVLTGTMMTHEVLGFEEEKCLFNVEMPNGGMMECKVTEDIRKKIADQKYRTFAEEQAIEFHSEISLEIDEEGNPTSTVESNNADGAFITALKNDQCVITGYEEEYKL